MSSWRDDLPPIPTERIRAEAIREGTRRREQRARRQRTALVGGAGAAAVALIVASGVLTGPDDGRVDNASVATAAELEESDATEAAAEATQAPAATSADTEAPSGTQAPADTAASEETTPPEATAVVDYTTIADPRLPSNDVSVVPAEIFEQLPSGPACGPSTFEVTFQPQGQVLQTPTVQWETSGVTGEAPMVIDGDVARATIGSFAAETLDEGVSYEVLVYVTDIDASGDVQPFRSPPVVLRDCSP